MPSSPIDAYPDFRKIPNSQLAEYISEFISDERKAKLKEILKMRTRHFCFVAENFIDEHNIHAVIRSSEGFGWQDFYNISHFGKLKKAKTVNRGSFQWTTVYNYSATEGIDLAIQHLREKGYKIYATSSYLPSSYTPQNLPIEYPTALILGTEHSGISKKALAQTDGLISIPMYGFTESYNVSVAAALIGNTLNERYRSEKNISTLSDEEQQKLYYQWLWYSIKNPDIVYKEWKKRNQTDLKTNLF